MAQQFSATIYKLEIKPSINVPLWNDLAGHRIPASFLFPQTTAYKNLLNPSNL